MYIDNSRSLKSYASRGVVGMFYPIVIVVLGAIFCGCFGFLLGNWERLTNRLRNSMVFACFILAIAIIVAYAMSK